MSAEQSGAFLRPSARPRVVLVYRRSQYQTYISDRDDAQAEGMLARDSGVLARWQASHDRQMAALDQIMAVLQAAPVCLEDYPRGSLQAPMPDDVALVISAGGDGTFLDTSHFLRQTPLLGVNTDPLTSVGFLCGATATTFSQVFAAFLAGELRVRSLCRLQATLGASVLEPPVLNEVLVAHGCPASTSKYYLVQGDQVEAQQSSGLWVATAAGSTAALRSAGGEVMDILEQRLQYRVREPYAAAKLPALTHGYVEAGACLEVISKMPGMRLYIDGPHLSYPMALGESLRLAHHPVALRQAYVDAETLLEGVGADGL